MTLNWMPDVFLSQVRVVTVSFVIGMAIEFVFPATTKRSIRALAFNLMAAVLFLYHSMLLVRSNSSEFEPFCENWRCIFPSSFLMES